MSFDQEAFQLVVIDGYTLVGPNHGMILDKIVYKMMFILTTMQSTNAPELFTGDTGGLYFILLAA